MLLHNGAEDVHVVDDDDLGVILSRAFADSVPLRAAVPTDDAARRKVLGLGALSADMAGLAATEAAIVASTTARIVVAARVAVLVVAELLGRATVIVAGLLRVRLAFVFGYAFDPDGLVLLESGHCSGLGRSLGRALARSLLLVVELNER